jgi:hypothetical protein
MKYEWRRAVGWEVLSTVIMNAVGTNQRNAWHVQFSTVLWNGTTKSIFIK